MNKLATKIIAFIAVFGLTFFVLISSKLQNNDEIFKEQSIVTDDQDIEMRNISKISNNFNLSEKYLNDNQLKYLDKTELLILRNEIFARHGYIFKREDLTIYFSQFKWYKPTHRNVSSFLNEIELGNIEKIKQYEQK